MNADAKMWFPLAQRKAAGVQAAHTAYKRVQHMNILASADPDRRVTGAVIGFPYEDVAYVISSPGELLSVIRKLQGLYDNMVASGQGRVVSFSDRWK